MEYFKNIYGIETTIENVTGINSSSYQNSS